MQEVKQVEPRHVTSLQRSRFREEPALLEATNTAVEGTERIHHRVAYSSGTTSTEPSS